MDWTIGPLDYWNYFGLIFLDQFLDHFLDLLFLNDFIGGWQTISTKKGVGGRMLLLREGR